MRKFEEARSVAIERFYTLHPKSGLPAWFLEQVTIGGTQASDDGWTISFTLAPKLLLEENESWEERSGRRVLVRIDPMTKKKGIVIHRVGAEPLVVFQVVVAPYGRGVDVVKDTNISLLDSSMFEEC